MGIIQSFRRVFGLGEMIGVQPGYDGWISKITSSQSGLNGFAALTRGLEIIRGQLTSTALLHFENDKEVQNSAIARAIKRTSTAHFDFAFHDCLTTGNGWMKIHRNESGSAHHFEAIQAFRISASMKDNAPEFRLDGLPMDMNDYLHFQCRNCFSPFLGDSLIESYSQSIASIVATLNIFGQLQSNGSFADVCLSTDMSLSKVQADQLRASWKDQTSGQNIGGVPILSNGLKPITFRRLPTALDQEIIRSMEFSVSEASRMTGVPLQFLSVKDSTSYASALQGAIEFHRVTVKPLMIRIQQEMSLKLDARIEYDHGEISLGFGSERAETLSKLVYSGVLNRNEARHLMGYGSAADCDQFSMPVNQAPVDKWLKANPSDPKTMIG